MLDTLAASATAPEDSASARLPPSAHRFAWVLATVGVLLGSGLAAAQAERTRDALKPATVFVPGVTGTRLEHPQTGEVLWGDASQLLRPKDRGYTTVLPLTLQEGSADEFRPAGLLSHMRMLTYTREIYRPLQRFLQSAGFVLGNLQAPTPEADLYNFTYDWRRENQIAVAELDRALTRLAKDRGTPHVRLLCQSNAGRICRYLAKYGGAEPDDLWAVRADSEALAATVAQPNYTIDLVVLISNSHGGALRQLHELHKGRKYVPGIGRFIGPETLFALRTLFEDLPFYRDDLFLDRDGVPYPIDLFEAENWQRYQWSIFRPETANRLRTATTRSLFGSPEDRLRYLRSRLEHAKQVNALLMMDAPLAAPNLCLLQNFTASTIERAIVDYDADEKRWRLLFDGDRGVPRSLRAKLTSKGDGHGTRTSQEFLSLEELDAVIARHPIDGGHFDSITKKATLDKLLDCLKQQDALSSPR